MPQRIAYVLVRFPHSLTGKEVSELVRRMEEPACSTRFQSLPDDCGFGNLIGLVSQQFPERNLCVAPDPRFGSFNPEFLHEAAAIGSYDWQTGRQLKPNVGAGEPDYHLQELVLFAERFEAELTASDSELRTPQDWLDVFHPRLAIRDPDGWRDGADFDESITKFEFESRLNRCTLGERPLRAATQWVGA